MGLLAKVARLAAASIIVGTLAGAVVAQDAIRMLDGELVANDPTQLPTNTLVVIEARDAQGRLLGEATLRTRGRQFPLPFELGIPEGIGAVLSAAVVVNGRIRLYQPDLSVPAGAGPTSLGEIGLSPYWAVMSSLSLDCAGTDVGVAAFDSAAILTSEGRRRILTRVPDAAGARYGSSDGPGARLLVLRNSVQVALAGEDFRDCAPVPPEKPEPYRAQGNEPGWSLTMSGGRYQLVYGYGASRTEGSFADADFRDGALFYESTDSPTTIRLVPEICRDDMTGMPHPDRAIVEVGNLALNGCGGDPAALLTGPEWTIEDIAGSNAVDGAQVTLKFDGKGGLGGEAGCNRYATSFDIGGEVVTVAPIAATQRACDETVMDQERAFFAALASVRKFDVDESGALRLFDTSSGQPAITARR